mgnify:CR=1 FL=1
MEDRDGAGDASRGSHSTGPELSTAGPQTLEVSSPPLDADGSSTYNSPAWLRKLSCGCRVLTHKAPPSPKSQKARGFAFKGWLDGSEVGGAKVQS